jgi:hypothetical protein
MQLKFIALLIFCSSQLTGFAQGPSQSRSQTSAREDLRGKSAEERAEFVSDKLSTNLSLSAEQKSQVYLLQLSFHEKVEQIRSSNEKTGEDTRPTPAMRKEISIEKQALDAKINELLSEAQRSEIERYKRHEVEGEKRRHHKGQNVDRNIDRLKMMQEQLNLSEAQVIQLEEKMSAQHDSNVKKHEAIFKEVLSKEQFTEWQKIREAKKDHSISPRNVPQREDK